MTKRETREEYDSPSVRGGALNAIQAYYESSDDELARRYVKDVPFLSTEYCERALAHRYALYPFIEPFVGFDQWQGRRVLEIGCGQGADLSRFARAGAQAYGCDLTARHCAISRAFVQRLGLTAQVAQASALSLPYPAASFDLVYSFGVLLLVDDLARALGEIKRILRPGGVVMAMFYNRLSLHYLVKTLYYYGIVCDLESLLGPRRLIDWFTDGFGYPRTYHQTPATLRAAFTAAGFDLQRLAVRNLTSEQVPLVGLDPYPPEFREWLASRAGFYLMIRAQA